MNLLYQRPGLPAYGLAPELSRLYGGELGFRQPCVYANFVASVDGVVALPVKEESGGIISKSNGADHFVMGLLRACAGTVLIGAGTFRKGEGQLWDAESIYPSQAAAFAALRRQLGLSRRPRFAVLSASGNVDRSQPALQHDAVVLSTAGTTLAALLAALPQPILCEGGPTLIGQLIAGGLLNELFLTRSPNLFGRQKGDDRKALVEGELLSAIPLKLLSLRENDSYLFLRYGL
jgi:riboflavin biosynthesis pyrimidine reductase